jgi:hypothetical protein
MEAIRGDHKGRSDHSGRQGRLLWFSWHLGNLLDPRGTGDWDNRLQQPSWQAQSSPPILEPRQARQALESDGWTSPEGTCRWRRDSEATSNRKTSHVNEMEPTQAWSDMQEQDSDGPRTSGPDAGQLLPGGASVACLFNSFFIRRSKVHPHGITIPSVKVTATCQSLLVFVSILDFFLCFLS